MLRFPIAAVALLFLAGSASTTDQNSSLVQENWCGEQQNLCGLHDDDGPWMSVLQQWALSAPEHGERQGRIMALPPAQGYYVTDRFDGPLLSPPPPPAHAPQHGKQPNYPAHPAHPAHPTHPLPPGARPYDEWQHSPPPQPTTGKIVNRPPNPYKDKFKPSPSYPAPVQNHPIPVHSHAVDRVDENRQPPQKQVSETDLYLLGAIEKLVWRADLFEKRLRKLEESVHLMVAGVDSKQEPCAENFTRLGAGCYHVSSDAVNWKGASYGCRRLKSNLLEIDSDQEREQLTASIFSDKKLKGGDFWTGGLNPGLLWIWSHSARPVAGNATAQSIAGDGRCLAWVSDPGAAGAAGAVGAAGAAGAAGAVGAAGARAYRGQDCALRHRYICEKEHDDTKLSNEIERVARKLREGRKPKILWTDDEP